MDFQHSQVRIFAGEIDEVIEKFVLKGFSGTRFYERTSPTLNEL